MIKTKRIFDKIDESDGIRLLITRYWPRGIKRSHITRWERMLAPSSSLLKQYRDNLINWKEFSMQYNIEMKTPDADNLINMYKEKSKTAIITLLCYEPDGQNCHRYLLKNLLD